MLSEHEDFWYQTLLQTKLLDLLNGDINQELQTGILIALASLGETLVNYELI